MAYFTKDSHYFDCNATTPVSAEVLAALPSLAQAWGNPSSIHWAGREPKNILRDTRKSLAEGLGCSPLELVFTSGGTESNNSVIRSAFEWGQKNSRTHFVCSAVEHPAVLKSMRHLETLGATLSVVPVNIHGQLDMEFLKNCLSEKTALVSIMLANNETGSIFPIAEVAKLAKSVGALVHTDAVQALGKMPIQLSELNVDYASFSAHKFYSIKGTGLLYLNKKAPFISLFDGGAQERHRRGGTENILGIGALGVMAKKLKQVSEISERIRALRDLFETRVLAEIENVEITNALANRIPNTSSMLIDGVDGETLLMSLDIKGYAVSTGAACSSGNPEPSPVLLAMGLTREQAQSSLRVSLGWQHTEQEVNEFVEVLKSVVQRLRKLKVDHQQQQEENLNSQEQQQALA